MSKNITNQSNTRIYLIDYIKITMSLIVVLYHYNFFIEKWKNDNMFRGGYICVDIFFIIGGFFFSKNMKEKPNTKFIPFIMHKTKALYPHYIVSLIFATLVNMWVTGYDVFWDKNRIIAFVEEIFLVQEWGIVITPAAYYNNAAAWYISAMFFVFILFFFLFRISNRISYLLGVVAIGLTYFLYKHTGHMHVHAFINGHISLGIIRAIIGMGFGCLAYEVMKWFKFKISALGLSIILLCGLLVNIYTKNSILDFAIIPISFIGIIFAYKYGEQRSKNPKTNNNNLLTSKYIGTLSYVIYLNHLTVKNIMNKIYVNYSVAHFVIVSLIVSVMILITLELFIKLKNTLLNK